MRWASGDPLALQHEEFRRHLRPYLALLQPSRIALHVVVRALCFLAQWKMQMRKCR